MTRVAVVVSLLVAAGLVVCLLGSNDDAPQQGHSESATTTRESPALASRPGPDPDTATAADARQAESPSARQSELERRLAAARARARLEEVRALHDASVANWMDLLSAERELWLARATAGEITVREAYAEVAKIDAEALKSHETLVASGRSSPEAARKARVRWNQSLLLAGDSRERYEEERASYLEYIGEDHAARAAAGVASPNEVHRRILEAATEFPLADAIPKAPPERD